MKPPWVPLIAYPIWNLVCTRLTDFTGHPMAFAATIACVRFAQNWTFDPSMRWPPFTEYPSEGTRSIVPMSVVSWFAAGFVLLTGLNLSLSGQFATTIVHHPLFFFFAPGPSFSTMASDTISDRR